MDFSLEALQAFFGKILLTIKRWQFSNKKQLAFLEDLYSLINDGIPANRAVEMMAQVSTGLNHDVALSIAHQIAQGRPLADGLSEWFSPNVVEIVRVGEVGGALAQTLKSSVNLLSQSGVAYGGFISAVTYPLFVIIVGCCVIIYLNNSVFEQFRAIKPIESWPEAGKQVVYLANFITYYWWIVILGIVGAVMIVMYVMTNYVGVFRAQLDKIPPFNFYKRLIAARLLETLGLLVSNGVVFKSAIKIMRFQAKPYLHSHLLEAEHLLSMGKSNIAEVLATGLVEEQDLLRLRIMSEVKGFEHGLIRMGVRGTENATNTLKFVSRIIGGVLLAIGGLLIIMIVRGIFMTGMAMGSIT